MRGRSSGHRLAGATLALVALLLGSAALAQNMSSPSFELRNGTLAGGGAVDLQSAAPAPSVQATGVTIGQSSPLGVSQGAISGISLESGFWPTVVPVPEPGMLASLLGAAGTLLWLRRRRA